MYNVHGLILRSYQTLASISQKMYLNYVYVGLISPRYKEYYFSSLKSRYYYHLSNDYLSFLLEHWFIHRRFRLRLYLSIYSFLFGSSFLECELINSSRRISRRLFVAFDLLIIVRDWWIFNQEINWTRFLMWAQLHDHIFGCKRAFSNATFLSTF